MTAALLVSCGGGGEPSSPLPAGLKLIAGEWAAVSNGVVFTATIQVVDAGGKAVDAEGIAVSVERTLGTAVLAGTLTRPTDAEGQVVFDDLVLIGPSALVQLTFANEALTGVSSPHFILKVGPVATLTKVAGDSQVNATNDTLLARPRVLARDAGGNPVVGASITATIASGAGFLIPESGPWSTVATYVTGMTGEATIRWRLGAPGANGITVTVQGVPSIPAVPFVATAVPGVPYRYETVSLLSLVPVVDSLYPLAAKVTVKDQYGNLVVGAPVRFYNPDSTVTTMSFTGDSGVTDAQGEFTLAAWRPGTRSGAYRIGARPGGPAGVAILADYSVVAGPFARIETPPPILLGRGMFIRFGVHTIDRFGNRVGGTPVTITKVSGAATYVLGTASDGDFPVDLTAPGAVDTTILRATAAALPDSVFDAVIRTVAPTAVRRVSGDSQSVVAGGTPSAPFIVRVVDTTEAPVMGVPLDLYDPNTGGLLQSRLSDSAGLASYGPFAQPIGVGFRPYDIRSTFVGGGGTALRLVVRLVAGPPAIVEQQQPNFGDTISGKVGQALDTLPQAAVLDSHDLPVAGVVVHFTTTRGQLLGDSAITNTNGIAAVPGWILDTVSGIQQVTATVAGAPPGQLTVIARAGPATQAQLLSPTTVHGFAGERLGEGATVLARDRYGNLAAGHNATVSIVSGDATLIGFLTVLSRTGRAYIDLWNLGGVGGSSVLRITVDSASVDFTATAVAPSPFQILLRGVPSKYAGVFNHAAYEWRRRITGDIPDLAVSIPGGVCASFQGSVNGTVDDLIIDVSIGPIDGVGGILGGATPCFIRTASKLPLLGVMQFDDPDLAALEADGTLDDVITHEMGHVLGIGSLWSTDSLILGGGTPFPVYLGAGGIAGWADIGGAATGSTYPLIENSGGQGTRDVHWREATVPSELMTGYLSAAVNPMSALTIRSLTDLGYAVDASMADPYTVFTAPPAAPGGRRSVRINDVVGRPKFEVDTKGRTRQIP